MCHLYPRLSRNDLETNLLLPAPHVLHLPASRARLPVTTTRPPVVGVRVLHRIQNILSAASRRRRDDSDMLNVYMRTYTTPAQ